MTTEERFWKNINKNSPAPIKQPHLGPCWLWTAGTNGKGYGALYGIDLPGRQMYAHRYSWVLHYGPIPDGLYCCHKCDIPRCTRPDHLFLGTCKDNVNDAMKKGIFSSQKEPMRKAKRIQFKELWKGKWNSRRGEGHETHKLSDDQIRKIRSTYKKGVHGYKRLAKEFPVSVQVIKRIVLRKNWAHI